MRKRLLPIILSIAMVIVPMTPVLASSEAGNLETINLEINQKELSEGDNFCLQVDMPEDYLEIDKLIVKYKLENTNNIKELELDYNDEEELWELDLEIDKGWEEGLWELYEMNYSLIEDADYQALDFEEDFINGNILIQKPVEEVIEETNKEEEVKKTYIDLETFEESKEKEDKESEEPIGESKAVKNVEPVEKKQGPRSIRTISTPTNYTYRSASSSSTSYHVTQYDKFFEEVLNIQMNRSPLTDLYGGGWKTARQDDVAYYLDPNNFLQFEPKADYGQNKTVRVAKTSEVAEVARAQIASSGKRVEVTADVLNVRQKPTTSSRRLTQVKEGSKFTVLDESNGWYKINANGKTGWISGKYVKDVDATSIGVRVEVTADALNVREKPTTSSRRLTQVKKGSKFTVLDESNGWYKIATNGKIGWVSAQYTKVVGATLSDITIEVTANVLNVRENPTTNSRRLTQVKKGSVYTVLGGYNGWYKITANGKIGWVSGEHVKDTGKTSVGKQIEVTANVLNVRRSPTTSSRKLTQVKKGGKFIVLSESNGWYEINANGKTGWVSGKHVKNADTTTPSKKRIEVAADVLNVREKPTTNSRRLTQVKKGSVYTVLGGYNGWYKITANGKTGWVSGEHVKPISISTPNGKRVEVTANVLNVREKPTTSSRRLTQVKKGSKFIVLDESNGWYKISANGKTGWVSGKYVKSTDSTTTPSDKRIEVTGDVLNVRQKPTTNSPVLTQVKEGSRFTVLDKSNDWYKIKANGKIGWVSGQYVKEIGVKDEDIKEEHTSLLEVTGDVLNVREKPTTDSDVVGQVEKNDVFAVLDESNGWYKISVNGKVGWVSGRYAIATSNVQYFDSIKVTASALNVREKSTTQSSILTTVPNGSVYVILDKSNGWYKINANGKKGWVSGDYVKSVTDVPREMYQFLVLSGTSGISVYDLNNALAGNGIFEGRGQAFVDASRKHNINELYLVSHAFLETGYGKSKLATGIVVDRVDGKPVEPRKVYNMFGIGAFDSDPIRLGAERAYKEEWFTPEAAIIGGAKFISESYINHPKHKQDTLYKMRWNPVNPGTHQYATDIGWASKQTRNIDIMMEICAQSSSVNLRFDVPKYR